MLGGMTGSDEALDVRSLAQYRPFEGDGEGMEAVHDDLVMAACQSASGFRSLEECRVFVRDTWHIDLEIGELRESRDRLEGSGLARQQGGGLDLTPGASKRLEEERQTWEEAERQAVQEWEAAVREEYPLLAESDVSTLKQQLRPWLDHVIARHGAEASLLLYPEHERADQLVESLERTDLDFLPACDAELAGVRSGAFRMFVREPSPSQRELLGRLLNTGFYRTVLSLDPKATYLAEAEAKQTTLYLDTNFLYSVLGVGSAAEAHAATRLLEICRELGYSLRVTPWTVDELRTSIASSRADVQKVHLSKKSAAVMAKVSGEKGFAAAYWRELQERGSAPADFFGKYEHFMRFLEDNGIVEHPEGCPEIDADVEAVRTYSGPLEGMWGPAAKRREVIEHDAKMRLLVERRRGEAKPGGYTDVRHWFLTESTRLPTYARLPIDSSHRPEYPFCVLSSTWAQVARALLPRTKDLDEVVVGLLASPYVGYRRAVQGAARTAVERVVARIDALKDVPPRVAIALVNDGAMAKKIGEETDEAEVDRLVEDSLNQKAAELEERVGETARRAAAAEREREAADARARAAAEELESTKAASEAERDRLRTEEREAAATRAEEAKRVADQHASEQGDLREQVSALEREKTSERGRREAAEVRAARLRNGIAVTLAVVVAAVSTALLLTGSVSGRIPAVLTIAGACVVTYLAVSMISNQMAKKLVIAITIFVGVASLAAALWPQEDDPAPGDSRARDEAGVRPQ